MRSTGSVDPIHSEQPDPGKIFSRCSPMLWEASNQSDNIENIFLTLILPLKSVRTHTILSCFSQIDCSLL